MASKTEAGKKVAFGTTLNRELLPLKIPPTRHGNELGLKGAPNRGPGCYNNNEFSTFVYELERKPVCRRGYSLGARTAPRFNKPVNMDTPGAPTYQEIISKPREFQPDFKPFLTGASRPEMGSAEGGMNLPGPGCYEHDVERERQVKFHGTFGGPQTLVSSIRIKCNENGEPDICMSCDSVPYGDYFEYKNKSMCRRCHAGHSQALEKYPKSYLQKFTKVRDCSSIHNHEGTNAKMRLMSEKDQRKQKYREAYMSLYFK